MIVEFHVIIICIYLISLSAASFCIWVKWDQDDLRNEMKEIKEKQDEILKQIEAVNKELNRMNIKSPFNGR